MSPEQILTATDEQLRASAEMWRSLAIAADESGDMPGYARAERLVREIEAEQDRREVRYGRPY